MVAQLTTIHYPESDGKPMADNTKQFHWITVIKQNLDCLFAQDPQIFIAGDLFWYPVEGRPNIVTAPDVLVVFGRLKGDRGSYKQWEENNIAPQVVFEILSPSNSKTEMEKKLIFYDRYGVDEYYIYDPDRQQLEGWLRGDNDSLENIPTIFNWVSPRLGIRFEQSEQELKLYRPDGTPFHSYNEINSLLLEERQRADRLEALLNQYRNQFGDLEYPET
ncbi:MAG: Uma2 family endonuclease [Woronichinia naegeliana WA131]|jgi:Uma2 family endonuclease|uniref:Uma2 family endonuclease n=1 Tax=Woronichinia naegeliana WA131 TaxID=2824559 RepID=A0A977PUX4_9CYAN|nr:MAG: Uma2 family endonuclease [Woronichinia naegeliana WA131]